MNSGSALLGLFSHVSVRLLGLGACDTSWCCARGAFTFNRRVLIQTHDEGAAQWPPKVGEIHQDAGGQAFEEKRNKPFRARHRLVDGLEKLLLLGCAP